MQAAGEIVDFEMTHILPRLWDVSHLISSHTSGGSSFVFGLIFPSLLAFSVVILSALLKCFIYCTTFSSRRSFPPPPPQPTKCGKCFIIRSRGLTPIRIGIPISIFPAQTQLRFLTWPGPHVVRVAKCLPGWIWWYHLDWIQRRWSPRYVCGFYGPAHKKLKKPTKYVFSLLFIFVTVRAHLWDFSFGFYLSGRCL